MTQDPNPANTNVEQKPAYEELQVVGEQLLSKVKELLHEGNVRRLMIKQDGNTIMEMPLTVGLVGAIAAPMLAAIGVIGALVARCSIEVVRTEWPNRPDSSTPEKVDNVTPYDGPAL